DREALLAEEAAHAEEEAALRAADEDDEDYADGEFDDGGYDDGQGVTEVDTSDKDHVATIEGGVIENGFDGEDEGAGDTTGSDAEDG
ncbi:hypothetical protein ABTL91_19675, partial [Acinetobacter baumannii]